jgi:iron complex outermembrane receptor protein
MKTKEVFQNCGYFAYLIVITVMISVIPMGTVFAQDSENYLGNVLEEVLVTAQKREQTLEDVPLSVSLISGENVDEFLSGSQDIRALAARVPGLNIETSNGRTQPRFYMRGLGNIDFDVNAAQPVAFVFDDIAMENPVLRSMPLFDIGRIEVLKGPQGTLFGKNTNAGAISVHSVKPGEERNGYVRASYGSRSTWGIETASNFGMSETFSMRASVKYQQRDEWIDNVFNGPGDDYGNFEELGWRLQFAWTPSDSFSALLKLHGFDQEGSDPNVFYANGLTVGHKGVRPGFNEKITNHDSGDEAASMETDLLGGALNLQWTFDNGMTFTSITGYDTAENFQGADVDGGEVTYDLAGYDGQIGKSLFAVVATGDGLEDHDQITQEFRLSGDSDQVFWQAGIFYFDEDWELLNYAFHAPVESAVVTQQATSWALFGQLEYELTDRMALTVGGRWTDDEKDLQVAQVFEGAPFPPGAISVSDDFFNWDAALSWDVNDDWNLYGRIAAGSRGPAVLGRFGFTSSVGTEDSTAFELGFKGLLADGRIRWNSAVYAFRNDDHQLTATGGEANINQLLSAEHVDGKGFETSLDWLVSDRVLISANYSYTDTEIDDPALLDEVCTSSPGCTWLNDFAQIRAGFFGPVTDVFIYGNPLPRMPKHIFNVVLQYSHPIDNGELYFNTDWNYRDESELFLYRTVEFRQDERWLGGLRAGWRTAKGWDFAVVGRNITNEQVVEGAIDFLNLTVFVNEPSYWGVEGTYRF